MPGRLSHKDKNNRILSLSREKQKLLLKNLIKNRNFLKEVRWKAFLRLSAIPKKSSFTYFMNRCVFTGRKKRIHKLYSFSRIMFLRLVRFGYLNGLRKSSW